MERKLAKIVNFVKMDEEDNLDVLYWQNKNISERLEEVVRLRKDYYTWLNGCYSDEMTKVLSYRHLTEKQP